MGSEAGHKAEFEEEVRGAWEEAPLGQPLVFLEEASVAQDAY